MAALHAALDAGLDFIDTADVYGDGHSERLIARVLKERDGPRPFVATKAGRRLPKQVVEGYTAQNLEAWIDRSLRNLGTDCLDLLQLHCPPTDAYYHPEIFEAMERLVEQGKIRHYGVSVERVEEASRPSSTRAWPACRSSSTCSGSARRSCSSGRRSAATWR